MFSFLEGGEMDKRSWKKLRVVIDQGRFYDSISIKSLYFIFNVQAYEPLKLSIWINLRLSGIVTPFSGFKKVLITDVTFRFHRRKGNDVIAIV